ncbi:MAG: NTP transferase domain-containing protein [Chloroflexi bacterium]|nr:NTP transferase domain-containing protein [Chloroflexota bacterium]
MSGRKPKYCILLAGGKGTRMRSADCHKVCFPIDGRPAINRALDIYKSCGIRQPIVVVGHMAGQVIETVGQEFDDIIYTYQAQQLGTGHATRIGLKALQSLDADGDVLLVAGDRIVEPFVLDALIDLYYARDCDMAFLMGAKGRRSDKGRIVTAPDGAPLADVEARDIWQREAYRRIRQMTLEGTPPSREAALAILRAQFDDRRAAKAFGPLWQALAVEGRELDRDELLALIPERKTRFDFVQRDGQPITLTPDEVEETDHANFSIYLAKISALRYALDNLSTDNAQGEEYLSDMITILAQTRENDQPRFVVEGLLVENPNYVMAFNDPAELLEIEAYFQRKKQPQLAAALPQDSHHKAISAWVAEFRDLAIPDATKPLWQELSALYGADPAVFRTRRRAYLEVLEHAARELGPETPVLLVHAPGRVNILGRHVDHQGGNCNLMAIDREFVMAVHPRDDDQVHLHNVDSDLFSSRRFSIGDLLKDLPWDDWMSLINSEKVAEMVCAAAGDWGQYVQAAVLRLQKRFPTLKLRGMDLVVQSNIPIAAGLSSSSALVVASAEATVAVNQLEVFPSQFVDLCGEGEWFVGTRGGSADHAGVKFGQKGKVAKVTFFEFGIDKMVDFPEDYRIVLCNSRIQAKKSGGAKDIFNQQVACYRLGFQLIKSFFPQYAPLLHHLRDVNARTLNVPLSYIYRILLRLPERATRAEILRLLPEANLKPLFSTHAEPAGGYPIRGVVLFGLAECERSRIAADLLEAGRVAEFGRLMNVSHNGDRVAVYDAHWQPQPYPYQVSNAYILDLMDDLESGDPERVVAAQLQWQPGAYGCSTPEIDLMVDVARQAPGVAGAQLAGAGLGGCMMVLAHRDATEQLARRLTEIYYTPRGLEPDVAVCSPIGGSGVIGQPRGGPSRRW